MSGDEKGKPIELYSMWYSLLVSLTPHIIGSIPIPTASPFQYRVTKKCLVTDTVPSEQTSFSNRRVGSENEVSRL
jgi:hypothetical protein